MADFAARFVADFVARSVARIGAAALLTTAALLATTALLAGRPPSALADSPGVSSKIGILGDSMASGTHSSDMCGRNDIVECIDTQLGRHSPEWSYAGGAPSWSIASRLGFASDRVVDAADDGEEWRDGLDQAAQVLADPAVDTVFIGLGANDVCQSYGHDYTGDLEIIEAHIDATLTFLTDSLPRDGRIYWSGVPNIVRFRNLMVRRDHNYMFESCQDTWVIDPDAVKAGAAGDACDHFAGGALCGVLDDLDEARDYIAERVVEAWLDMEGVDHGPCGKILDRRSRVADRREARAFIQALNTLMADKAALYNGRNGVAVYYTDVIYDASNRIRPYDISRLDCYHPSRTGQMKLAREIWRGFDPTDYSDDRIYFDELDSPDYCAQEFTSWSTCWNEIAENDGPVDGDVRIRKNKLRVSEHDKGVWREADLSGAEETWMSFGFRRTDVENDDEWVAFDVSPDAGLTWQTLEIFAGRADDEGLHRGSYYDITEYAGPETRIRFLASPRLGDQDSVDFDNITITSWAAPAVMPLPVGQWAFEYSAVASPSALVDPVRAQPIGFGRAAGTTGSADGIDLRVALAQPAGPIDVYLAWYRAEPGGPVQIVMPSGELRDMSQGLVAWRSGVDGPLWAAPLGPDAIPADTLEPGRYEVAMMVTPAGSLASLYVWGSSLEVTAAGP